MSKKEAVARRIAFLRNEKEREDAIEGNKPRASKIVRR